MTSGTFLFVHTCFFWVFGGCSLEQLESGKSPSVLSNRRTRQCRSTFQTQSSVILGPKPQNWYVSGTAGKQIHLDGKRPGSGGGWGGGAQGTRACWMRAAGETLKVSGMFIHQSKNSRTRWAVSLGTHTRAQSFSLIWCMMSICARTGLRRSGSSLFCLSHKHFKVNATLNEIDLTLIATVTYCELFLCYTPVYIKL